MGARVEPVRAVVEAVNVGETLVAEQLVSGGKGKKTKGKETSLPAAEQVVPAAKRQQTGSPEIPKPPTKSSTTPLTKGKKTKVKETSVPVEQRAPAAKKQKTGAAETPKPPVKKPAPAAKGKKNNEKKKT